MLLQAAIDLGIDLKSSFMIGDKQSDVEAGISARCSQTILLGDAGQGDQLTFPDLLSACHHILNVSIDGKH